MKTSTPQLRALLASRQFYSADLYSVVLTSGTTLRYTSGDRDIISGGNTFSCGGLSGPFLNRTGEDGGLCSWRRGLQVDTMQFAVIPGSATVNGIAFLTACGIGLFDGAEVQLERAYMPTYGDTSYGTIIMFVGRIAEIDAGRSFANFQVASHIELLNQQIPRNLYQASCGNSLFDATCALNKAAYAVTGTVGSGSTAGQINTTLGQATGYFDLGVITFTSGQNYGLSRTVKSYTNPSTVKLIAPFPAVPAAGDTFSIYPGCDKTLSTCSGKFSNQANYRGAPFVPVAETAG